MAEMAVVVKRYRRERGRLYESNRKLLERLAEVEAQVLCVRTFISGKAALRCNQKSFLPKSKSGVLCRKSRSWRGLIRLCPCRLSRDSCR